ncbi:histidine triad (HIT) protein [Haliangium ochraceum DSM 14365]|uniref:Histidine triad (HIT) protein n=2 Tax=Haliangium ochraceum TaxID=80816 RepID=D0LL79_HALO1|nr:histidine triad (HIT) protein [Haliangium ochraceum DSM 14365]
MRYNPAMSIVVIGANGQIGAQLCELAAAAGHAPRAVVRREQQAQAFRARGIEAVVADLEGPEAALAAALAGATQVVFSAGSGASTGKDKTLLVDLHGAVRCIDLAVAARVRHFVMISAYRVVDPLAGPEPLRPYLAAKLAADRVLAGSGLHYTILRPGRLTDEPGTGRVRSSLAGGEGITIPRADVAAAALAALGDPVAADRAIDLLSGDTPIAEIIGAGAAAGSAAGGEAAFVLHERLRADTVEIGRLPLCRVLLARDGRYPWVILVPARAGIREAHELPAGERERLARESAAVAARMQSHFAADKMNVAALGNMVPQLHVHHVARFAGDDAWPAPIWGAHPAAPYDDAALAARVRELRAAFAEIAGFTAAAA